MIIPYVGQVGTGANEHGNDCGAACAAMIISAAGMDFVSVDAIYNEINPKNDTYLSVGGVMSVLSRRGIDVDWDANIPTSRLKSYTDSGRPCIALIRYGALSGIRPNKFTGSHFVVILAVDDYFVTIHDPLNTPTTGENVRVPRVMFDTSWSTVGDGNPQRGAIICSIEEVETMKGIVLADGLAIRRMPFIASTCVKRVNAGTELDVEDVEAIWARLKDGTYVAVKYNGEDLVKLEE